jgi:hypothetical protein
MKKLVLVLAIATLVSCTKDEVECNCDVSVIVVDGAVGITGRYTITNVPSDCGSGIVDWNSIRQDLPSNHWFERTLNCD